MAEDRPSDHPLPEDLETLFYLTGTRVDEDEVRYVGESLVPERALMRELAPAFRERGYDLRLGRTDDGQDVLVARKHGAGQEGIPWVNVAMFVATLFTTLFVGATAWYYIPMAELRANPLLALEAWPFTAAVLGVLLTHELGHYVVARKHGVHVSLPYVIPFFVPFGTLGAVIRMKGVMPSRKALFDVGVAGPLAGLVATVVVTAIGLSLEPMRVPEWVLAESGRVIIFHNPPLLELIATALGEPTTYEDPTLTVHPVVIGGWVGMFFTVLNLLPVGQLDGGHIVRAMVGERQESIAAMVPLALFGLAGYLHYVRGLALNDSVGLWIFWGFFAALIAVNGSAAPSDEAPLGWKRLLLGVVTFALGLLCLVLVPVEVVST